MRFEFIDCALLLQGRYRVRTMVCGGWNTDALGFFVGPDTFDWNLKLSNVVAPTPGFSQELHKRHLGISLGHVEAPWVLCGQVISICISHRLPPVSTYTPGMHKEFLKRTHTQWALIYWSWNHQRWRWFWIATMHLHCGDTLILGDLSQWKSMNDSNSRPCHQLWRELAAWFCHQLSGRCSLFSWLLFWTKRWRKKRDYQQTTGWICLDGFFHDCDIFSSPKTIRQPGLKQTVCMFGGSKSLHVTSLRIQVAPSWNLCSSKRLHLPQFSG